MEPKQQLINLCDLMAKNECITHWAISMRVLGKGDFFHGLMNGRDCRTVTYRKIITRFSEIWPDDLPWPKGIPRPKKPKSEAA